LATSQNGGILPYSGKFVKNQKERKLYVEVNEFDPSLSYQ